MRDRVVRRLALVALLLSSMQAGVASTSLQPQSLRQLGGRQVWLPICSRRGVNGSAAFFDNTNTAVMDQVSCISPSYGAVTAIKLVYAGFDMPQQGEIDRPVTATGYASIVAPTLNSFTIYAGPSVASGSTTLSFAAGTAGVNAISAGQTLSTNGTGIASGTYVASVATSFGAGGGNTPGTTTVTLSTATTAATTVNQALYFSGWMTPAKFGGRRQFTVEPAHDLVTSDAMSVNLPAGTQFFVRTAASFSATGLQLMDYPGSGSKLTGEFDSRSTSLNDQTGTPAVLSNTGGGFWCPVAVLGLVSVPFGTAAPGGVLILGDSIAAGTGDTADALGLQGYIQRSLENNVPFVNAARGSTTAAGLALGGDGQYALSIDDGVTDVLLEDGRNDVLSLNLTAATVEQFIGQVAARYAQAGKRVWCFTVPPTTQSNDGWTTLGNQSWTLTTATLSSAAASGATSVVLGSIANVAVGQAVAGSGIAAGTTVTALNSSTLTITLSAATTAAIASGGKLSFGTANAASSSSEQQRLAYNGFMRASSASLGCTGLIDVESVLADPGGSGKWRVDLGSASVDGVHPSAALHQAIVTAGLIRPSMFQPQ